MLTWNKFFNLLKPLVQSRLWSGIVLVALFSVWPGSLRSFAAEQSMLSPRLPALGAVAVPPPPVDWSAVPWLEDLRLTSRSVLVVRVPDGRLMGALNPEEALPLASLTKVMTAVVTMELNSKLDRAITMTKEDNIDLIAPYVNAGDRVSRIVVKDGEALRLGDMLKAALVGSANNAAAALARSSGLTLSGFVARMNLRAQVLGMYGTRFTESTGLDSNNTSTAYDFAILARYAWANKTLRMASSLPEVRFITLGGKSHRLRNTNSLLLRPPKGITPRASKTGYLTEAGYNLAFQWRAAGGTEYLMVLLGAPTLADRTADAQKLIRWLEPKS